MPQKDNILEAFIRFFAERHLLANLLMIAVFIGGVFAWQQTSKEELPDVTFDFIRINTSYPGASAEEVEMYVTRPLEDVIQGLEGVYQIQSTSSLGGSNITIDVEPDYEEFDELLEEVRSAINTVDLPADVRERPVPRVFETSKKAILDIALIYKGKRQLDNASRETLQRYAKALETQLMAQKEVNSVSLGGYLKPEIRIVLEPEKLKRFDIPFNSVINSVRSNHVSRPAGTLQTPDEPLVAISSRLDTKEKLDNVIIQGGFEGKVIRLSEIAEVASTYEKKSSITKINGHEGIIINVVKNSSYGILEALDAVNKTRV